MRFSDSLNSNYNYAKKWHLGVFMRFKNLIILTFITTLFSTVSTFANCTIDVAGEKNKDFLELLKSKNYQIVLNGEAKYSLLESDIVCSHKTIKNGKSYCTMMNSIVDIQNNETGDIVHYDAQDITVNYKVAPTNSLKELDKRMPKCI